MFFFFFTFVSLLSEIWRSSNYNILPLNNEIVKQKHKLTYLDEIQQILCKYRINRKLFVTTLLMFKSVVYKIDYNPIRLLARMFIHM